MSTFTYPSVSIATYLTFTAKRWGQFPTITFTNGAVAGNEVVSIDSNNNLFVQIESGVSTNTQIKAAVEAHTTTSGFAAGDLVSVAITAGHESDPQISCVNATLLGGIYPAVSAAKDIGHLLYTAVTPGNAGNSIRVKYTSGGSLSVSVSSNDITVQLKNDGTSTNALIIAAIAGSMSASALVTAISDGRATDLVPGTDAAPAFVNLVGGLDATVASVEVQDLTIASDSATTGPEDNGRTLTYTSGGTAGMEVVTIDDNGNIDVEMDNGVSTATQIKTALDASSDFNGVQATGTLTVNDYAPLHLTKASGSVTYGTPDVFVAAVKATADITVLDYSKLTEETAIVSGPLTFGTPSDGSTVIVTGPMGGPFTFTKATAVPEVEASLTIGDITYTAISPYTGAAGNAISMEYIADITGNQAVIEVHGGVHIIVHMDDTAVTGTTGNTIKAAVNADDEASLLVLASGTDTAVQAAQSQTPLSGGQDAVPLGPNEFEVIGDLTSLIDGLSGLSATDDGTDVTITVDVAGTGPNSWTVTGTSSYSLLSLMFSGGQNHASITVDTTTIVEGTDFTAHTSNDTTAGNIADALDAAFGTEVASAAMAVVTFSYPTAGTIGNGKTVSFIAASGGLSSDPMTANGADQINPSTITVDGNLFTCVASMPGADEFSSISELTALIDALSTVDATDDGSIITVVAATAGLAGNSIVMSKTGAGLTLVQLSGGQDAATFTVGSTTFVESTDFNAATSNNNTATSIASAINGSSEPVSAIASMNIVTITADAVSGAGNDIALASSDPTDLEPSGDSLAGGISRLRCTITGTGSNAQVTVNGEEMSGAVAPDVLGFFLDESIAALTSSFVYSPFAIQFNTIIINNDETTGTKQVIFSWDGINNHGILDPGENVTLLNAHKGGIFLKYGNGAPAYRAIAI